MHSREYRCVEHSGSGALLHIWIYIFREHGSSGGFSVIGHGDMFLITHRRQRTLDRLIDVLEKRRPHRSRSMDEFVQLQRQARAHVKALNDDSALTPW